MNFALDLTYKSVGPPFDMKKGKLSQFIYIICWKNVKHLAGWIIAIKLDVIWVKSLFEYLFHRVLS